MNVLHRAVLSETCLPNNSALDKFLKFQMALIIYPLMLLCNLFGTDFHDLLQLFHSALYRRQAYLLVSLNQ